MGGYPTPGVLVEDDRNLKTCQAAWSILRPRKYKVTSTLIGLISENYNCSSLCYLTYNPSHYNPTFG